MLSGSQCFTAVFQSSLVACLCVNQAKQKQVSGSKRIAVTDSMKLRSRKIFKGKFNYTCCMGLCA